MVLARVAAIANVAKWIACDRVNALNWLMIACIIVVIWIVYTQYEARQMAQIRRKQFLPKLLKMEGFQKIRAGDNNYKVHEDLENPQEAAQLMDRLNTTAQTLINHVYKKYIGTNEADAIIKPQFKSTVLKGVAALKKNFKTANLEENIPERSGGDTSYVIDKGDVFAMCLRDPKNNNKIEDKYNNLVFVLIHELAHLSSKSYGHPVEFWQNFRFLLQEAATIDLYQPVDYKKTGSPYCGIVVSYSPLYDTSLKDYYKN